MKPPKAPYPTIAALAAMLRADDEKAVAYVVAALKFAGGSVRGAAKVIGCGLRTLYAWRDSNERLGAAFAEHALGREGAGPMASAARAQQMRAAARKGRPKAK